MVNAREILQKARDNHYAVGAFNAANLETLKAVMRAAENLRSPVIIETSPGETDFIGVEMVVAATEYWRKKINVPILLNLDHALTVEAVEQAANAGYDLLHFDGSKLPLEENLALTLKAVELAHSNQKLVEAEIDHITGSSEIHEEKAEEMQKTGQYSDPEKSKKFVTETSVDTLAVFIGNIHGVYATSPEFDFDLLAEIRDQVPCFLSLHGGSGTRDEDIKKAVETGGIVKVNFNTELRIAYRDALKKALAESEEVAMYKIMPPVIEAVQKVVENKIRILGSESKT